MMKTPRQIVPSLLLGCLLLLGCKTHTDTHVAVEVSNDPSEDYPNPERFENAIKKFEAADAENMPPDNAVLCIGSSSMRMWRDHLEKDLAPLTVIGRGFGGSNTNDVLHYADRIIIPYQPRAIVIYEGDNDVAQGISPEEIAATYAKLLDKIDTELPDCRVYILAVKPSIKRWSMWPTMQRVNALLAELARERDGVTYIDIATPMLNDAGEPRPDLFIEDDLHMNRKGYEVWRDTIRPILVDTEKQYERQRVGWVELCDTHRE